MAIVTIPIEENDGATSRNRTAFFVLILLDEKKVDIVSLRAQ